MFLEERVATLEVEVADLKRLIGHLAALSRKAVETELALLKTEVHESENAIAADSKD